MFAVQCNILDGISIHASEKEATRILQVTPIKQYYFNPRLREGGDFTTAGKFDSKRISIHASEKEATVITIVILFIV